MLEKLDAFTIRIYNWFIIKIVVTFLVILAIFLDDRNMTIKELLGEADKFVLSIIYEEEK